MSVSKWLTGIFLTMSLLALSGCRTGSKPDFSSERWTRLVEAPCFAPCVLQDAISRQAGEDRREISFKDLPS